MGLESPDVAIRTHIPDQSIAFIKQSVIDAKAVNSHGGRGFPGLLGFFHAFENLLKEDIDIPVAMAFALLNQRGPETVNFLKFQFFPFIMGEDMARAGGAYINGEVVFHSK